jgi:demethylmenaquinone methyltransferase / 2-methoxy-6-polyprenyl-1,4-benzoquinol methylase
MDTSGKISDHHDIQAIGPMFDSIAWRYDFLNHLLSLGIDRSWRKKAIRIIGESQRNPRIIDVATGTGDLAIEAASLDPVAITGIDISEKMLELAKRKADAEGLSKLIEFRKCESEEICFEDNSFDVAMVAFGVRNFSDPLKGLTEMGRVLRKGGFIMVLEFSRPDGTFFKHIYKLYFHTILPSVGGLFSKNRMAYKYLNESVMKFPDNDDFLDMLKKSGFSEVKQTRLTKGIASIYTGIKV